MAGSDRGLDLRLPWGRPSPPGPERPRAGGTGRERPDKAGETGRERPHSGGDAPTKRFERRREGHPERQVRDAAPEPHDPARGPRHDTDDDGAGAGGREPGEREPDRAAPAAAGSETAPPDLEGARLSATRRGLGDGPGRLELGILPCFTRLEEQAAAHAAALEARLEKLESRLLAVHDSSIEAVGLLAGQLVARLEEQVAGIESATEARHERLAVHVEASMGERHAELLTRLEANRRATMEALSGLACASVVDRLLEGVDVLGQVLDADPVNLRRLITDEHVEPIGLREVDGDAASRTSQRQVVLDEAVRGRGAGSVQPPP